MKENLICISCPLGCHLEVEIEDKTIMKISGNSCPRGEIYATEELLAPKRVVTATSPTNSKANPRISVKTTAPILKNLINPLIDEIHKVVVPLPVKCGDVIITNFRDSGVNVVVTRSLKG